MVILLGLLLALQSKMSPNLQNPRAIIMLAACLSPPTSGSNKASPSNALLPSFALMMVALGEISSNPMSSWFKLFTLAQRNTASYHKELLLFFITTTSPVRAEA